MINAKFEEYKLSRELRRSGKPYEFSRHKLNEYGEPLPEKTIIGGLVGLYHESTSYIYLSVSNATQSQTKKVPQILCLYGAVSALGIKANDKVVVNGKEHRVTGIDNVQEWNIIADISLELIVDGDKI